MNITEWPNPENWIDILDHVLVALFMLAIAVVPSWISIRGNKGIKDIKNQVVNGHTSALRDDLDKALAAINGLSDDLLKFRQAITDDVSHLRRELSDEETRRRNNISDIRSEYERRFSSIDDRLDR